MDRWRTQEFCSGWGRGIGSPDSVEEIRQRERRSGAFTPTQSFRSIRKSVKPVLLLGFTDVFSMGLGIRLSFVKALKFLGEVFAAGWAPGTDRTDAENPAP
jgi:hypothetical protein